MASTQPEERSLDKAFAINETVVELRTRTHVAPAPENEHAGLLRVLRWTVLVLAATILLIWVTGIVVLIRWALGALSG